MSAERIFFIAIAALIVSAVFYLLRNRQLREKYAALWVGVGLVSLVLAIFPSLLDSVAGFFGVEIPSNLLFVLAILLLLAVTLHLSLEISRLEDETRILAEHVAILNALQDQPAGRGDPEDGATSGTRDEAG